MPETMAGHWRDIALSFLKVGATAYGGPAIMGLMQAEFQEHRQWTTKPRFLEGLALVNVLPGAIATQLGIFSGMCAAVGGAGSWPDSASPRRRSRSCCCWLSPTARSA
jgi:chromate transport protein ChrA